MNTQNAGSLKAAKNRRTARWLRLMPLAGQKAEKLQKSKALQRKPKKFKPLLLPQGTVIGSVSI